MLALSAAAWAQPRMGHFTPREGNFRFSATTITAGGELRPIAEYAAPYLGCRVSDTCSSLGGIVLDVDGGADLPAEGFRIGISPDHIAITGRDYGGVFNGVQELFRRLPAAVYTRKGLPQEVTLPCGEIVDAPRFPYRGLMIDVSRTWSDKERILRYVDLLAFHNINKLHLHLTDDEGWRVEIRSHPELTRVGAFRGGDSPVPAVYGRLDEKYGGFYTQEDLREIVAYAATRNIEIIPEIDLPGHSRAIGAVMPEIKCNYPADTVTTVGVDYRSAWCVAREENYRLLDDILGEVCDIFPSKYIHVGGDEVDVTQWNRCPDCRALMRRRGITDAHALQDLFQRRVNEILAAHGKQPAVWNEAAARGTISKENLVYGWQNLKACRNVVSKGYPTVMMTSEHFYIDMRQGKYEPGHSWAGIIDAKKLFEFNFAQSGFTEEDKKHIVGFEVPFWSETYTANHPESDDFLDFMCFPRVCALARLGWNGDGESWESYYREMRTRHYDRLAAMNVSFRLYPPKITYTEGRLSAATDDNSRIWYAVDGGELQPYEGAITTDRPYRYTFVSRYGSGRSHETAHSSYYKCIYPAVKITSSMGMSKKYLFERAEKYRSMAATSRGCRKGDWILYTFEGNVSCREIFVQTGFSQIVKSVITSGYAEISYDGTRFEKAGDLCNGAIRIRPVKSVKAIRLVSTSDGNGTAVVNIQPLQIKPRR